MDSAHSFLHLQKDLINLEQPGQQDGSVQPWASKGGWVQKPHATRPALWRKNRTMMNQCPAFMLGEFFTNIFQESYHREHPKCGCVMLKPILTIWNPSTEKDVHCMGEPLGFPRYIQPLKVLWDSFFQDRFVAPWPQGTAALRSSHQLLLLPCLQKPGISVLFTADIAGPKVVTFSIWGAVKIKLLCCPHWPCCTSLQTLYLSVSWKK